MKNDIGIDLGTANVLVYAKGKGIILNEPSVVAINKNTDEVVAIGKQAKEMIGKTPGNIVAMRPLKDGVIADYNITAKMLKHFISKSIGRKSFFGIKPRVVVCAPSGVTEVEKRAIFEATIAGGAKEAFIIEEPFAAAIGANLPVSEPIGSMVVDIGGGTTEVAIISLGGIVEKESIRTAGDNMDHTIIQHIRRNHQILIGERTAEKIKMELGCAIPLEEEKTLEIKGRDLLTGLPKLLAITSTEISTALNEEIEKIIDSVKNTIEKCPPELAGDIMDRGIALTGGGALLQRLDERITQELKTPAFVAENAMNCVAIGTGKSLESITLLETMKARG